MQHEAGPRQYRVHCIIANSHDGIWDQSQHWEGSSNVRTSRKRNSSSAGKVLAGVDEELLAPRGRRVDIEKAEAD
jgi:hypothetical protein